MILAAEIALLLMGLYALVVGKLYLSRQKVVYGAAARILALLCFAPMPLAFAATFLLVRNQSSDLIRWHVTVVEAGSLVFCTALMYIIGWPIAGPPWTDVALEVSSLVKKFEAPAAPVPVVKAPADEVFLPRVRHTLICKDFQLADPLVYRKHEIVLLANRHRGGAEEYYLFCELEALDLEGLDKFRKDAWEYAWAHRDPRSGLSLTFGDHLYSFAVVISKFVDPALVHDPDGFESLVIYDSASLKLHYCQQLPEDATPAFQKLNELIKSRLEADYTDQQSVTGLPVVHAAL
jgi:hypothetical protein